MKRITFLFGAGCEGAGQIGLPSGFGFKKDTVLADKVAYLFSAINPLSKQKITNGPIIRHNSTNILYQTIIENPDLFEFSPAETAIINQYISVKENDFPNRKDKAPDNAYSDFAELYRKKFYNEIKGSNPPSNVTKFLERAGFYSFLDSYFNFLRMPDKYEKEVARVIKVYYAAFNSILHGLLSQTQQVLPSDCREFGCRIFQNKKANLDLTSSRHLLSRLLESMQEIIIDNNSAKDNLYYNIIHGIHKEHNFDFKLSVVTTNYTNFAEKMLRLSANDISYVHGRMDWFESLTTKRVDKITAFSENETIFPFILIQSGVKPVISPLQVNELHKAVDNILNVDMLFILGYGINSDDEHISTIIRERLHRNMPITCFIYSRDDKEYEAEKDRILSILPYEKLISFCPSTDVAISLQQYLNNS